MTYTIHVYPTDASYSAWMVKKEEQRGRTYRTKGEAVDAAKRRARRAKMAQVAVHADDGRLLEYRNYGLPRLQTIPPGKGTVPEWKIAAVIGKMVLERLRSEGEHTAQK